MKLIDHILPGMLIHTAMTGCRVLAALYAIHLGASPVTVGIVVSLLGVPPMLFSVHAGRMIGHVGVRGPMLVGAALVVAGMLLGYLLPRLEILFLVTMLTGSGFVLFHLALNQIAGAVGGAEDRVRNFSVLALTFSTSGFLGPMIAGFAIEGIGYGYTFLLFSACALAALLLLSMRGANTPKRVHAPTEGRQSVMDLLRDPTLRAVFIASASLGFSWDLFTFAVPLHGTGIGLSPSQIGLILGAFGAAIFVVRLMLPIMAHRLDQWRIVRAAMIATCATFIVFPMLNAVPALMLLGFFLGLGMGASQPMVMSLLFAHAPPGRGAEAVGVRVVLINAGQSGVPLMFGTMGAAAGTAPAFWLMAALVALAWHGARTQRH